LIEQLSSSYGKVKINEPTKGDEESMGWSMAGQTDFGGYQIELALLFTIWSMMAIWVFYHSDRYVIGVRRSFYCLLTLLTGPIGLFFYIFYIRTIVD